LVEVKPSELFFRFDRKGIKECRMSIDAPSGRTTIEGWCGRELLMVSSSPECEVSNFIPLGVENGCSVFSVSNREFIDHAGDILTLRDRAGFISGVLNK
jgi:hypothetical protein